MPNLINKPLGIGRLPTRPGLGSAASKPQSGITSIARQTGRTSAFHQLGDSVSHTQNNERSGKVFGSINRAIKSKTDPNSTLPNNKNNPINQNYKPIIK